MKTELSITKDINTLYAEIDRLNKVRDLLAHEKKIQAYDKIFEELKDAKFILHTVNSGTYTYYHAYKIEKFFKDEDCPTSINSESIRIELLANKLTKLELGFGENHYASTKYWEELNENTTYKVITEEEYNSLKTKYLK